MNRIYSVLLVVATSCFCVFAASTNITTGGSIDLSSFQFSGSGDAPTNYAANVENVTDLLVSGSTFDGGTGADFSGIEAIIVKDGGAGLRLSDVGLVTISDSEFQGGLGGSIETDISSNPDAKGGHGIEIHGDVSFAPLGNGIVAIGGDGGSINNDDGRAKAFGGDGVNGVFMDNAHVAQNLVVSNGTYQGGRGGIATFKSDEIVSVYDQTQLNINGARGGHGMRFAHSDSYQGSIGSSLMIAGGTFTGGAGNQAHNTGTGSVNADGGHGLFVDTMDVNISGGTFMGGVAGTTNGIVAGSGVGAVFQDSKVSISGGSFQGDTGLRVSSRYYVADTSISGGTFSGVEFVSIDDGVFGAPYIGNNVVAITGGRFGRILVDGNSENNISLTAGTLTGDFVLAGSGEKNIIVQSDFTISGLVSLNGGVANVALGTSDASFKNAEVNSGTMNFSGAIFNLGDGDSFALMDQGAVVDFGGGLLAESNSLTTISFDGTTSTAIKGGALEFEEGARWIVDGGDSAVLTGMDVTMAEGASLVASTNASYVTYEGSGGSWLGGITSLRIDSGTDLVGTYGYLSFEKALGLDPDSEFGKAMADLSVLTDIENSGDAEYADLKALSEDTATATLADGYVRAPEMANTLIQLQGLFADQIKDRTRSHLRHQNWGSSVASAAPQGAQGPDAWDSSTGWMNSHLPKWDARKAIKGNSSPKVAKAHPPKSERIKIEIPASYQIWGRGYGSRIEQDATTGFGGYNANIGGAVLGVDKRFNNLLVGLGGGYAHTTVDGNWGSDGEADTAYGTVYAAATAGKAFFDFNINYAFNDVETESSPIMQYEGDYNASTMGFYAGGGMELDMGRLLFSPEVSLLATFYDRDGYTETSTATGPYPDKEWDAYSQWSYLTSLGATLSMRGKIDSFSLDMEFRPEIRAHWLHELNADMDAPVYSMVPGSDIGVTLQAREEDLIKVGTGVRFSKWDSDSLEFGIDLDGTFGQDYAAYMISGKLMHRF